MTTFRARFDGQVLIPEHPLDLPEGSVVEILATLIQTPTSALQALTKLAADFPANPDLPVDSAAQHDHYLYQSAKRP